MKEAEIILNDLNSVSDLLKKYRKEKKITQDELANYAGLSRTGIIKMESGDSDILLSSLIKISNLLGFDVIIRERGVK